METLDNLSQMINLNSPANKNPCSLPTHEEDISFKCKKKKKTRTTSIELLAAYNKKEKYASDV